MAGLELINGSDVMRHAVEEAELAAELDAATVLIAGEAGVGKECLARFIHTRSPRWLDPFVVVSCAAAVRASHEEQGHDAGTNWLSRANAKAAGGTVFLRGVHQLTQPLQADLMRLLEAGASAPRARDGRGPAPVRIICTAPESFRDNVKGFRPDLYYRLNSIYLPIPPLRERPEEIDLLLRHFVARAAERRHVALPSIRAEWTTGLDAYGWPGNLRELQMFADSIVARSMGMEDLVSSSVH